MVKSYKKIFFINIFWGKRQLQFRNAGCTIGQGWKNLIHKNLRKSYELKKKYILKQIY